MRCAFIVVARIVLVWSRRYQTFARLYPYVAMLVLANAYGHELVRYVANEHGTVKPVRRQTILQKV